MFPDIDTPALLLDLGAARRNIRSMATRVKATGKTLRPHVKGHKNPQLAHMQLEAGAVGIACAKLSEAEIMVQSGVRNVLITTEIVGQLKIERLLRLAGWADVSIVVDNPRAAGSIASAAAQQGLTLGTLVDVNVGQDRCGVAPGKAVVELASAVSAMPGLEFRGLQGYDGHLQAIRSPEDRRIACVSAIRLLEESVALLLDAGIHPSIVTTGGTGTYAFALDSPAVTEVQPGSYVVMDGKYRDVVGEEFDLALYVLSTVVSRPTPHRAIVDSGFKAVSTDAGAPTVRGRPDLVYSPAGDEHGRIESSSPREEIDLEVGERIMLVPSHCDTTINLYDNFDVVSRDAYLGRWPVTARGKTQ